MERKELTDEWGKRGIKKGVEYAILTDEITKAWSGMTTRQYKNLKGLKKENLRDNMSTLELVLNMLAEATTAEISKEKKPETFEENHIVSVTIKCQPVQIRRILPSISFTALKYLKLLSASCLSKTKLPFSATHFEIS